MSARFLTTLAVALAFAAGPAFAADSPAKKPDTTAALLKALEKEIPANERPVADVPLTEMLGRLSKKHGVTFIILEEQFKAAAVEGIKDARSPLKKVEGDVVTLRRFLTTWLVSIGAGYNVRGDYIEIVPLRNVKISTPAPAPAADSPAKKPDTTAALLVVLFEQEVQLSENTNLNDVPLMELLSKLSKQYAVTFVIQEEYFRAVEYPGDIKEVKPRLAATNLRGLSLHQFLTTVLSSMDATYMVKGSTIEIVPQSHATKLAKAGAGADKGPPSPLVSLVVKEKPLNEAVALIAERYDLTVVVSPQAGDAKTGFVTARILNVPAADALDLLAIQSDLRVVRKGNAFLITSRDHANELFAENLEKQRQMIELDKFRAAPPPKPQPEPKPEPQPGIFLLKGAGGLDIPLQIKPEPKPQPPK